jgi:hypothetical protein
VLVQVKNKHERSSPVRPLGVEKTCRFGSREPVASGVKCGSHGGMNSKMKSWRVSWLSLKTKVEPGLHVSRVMSSYWRRLHRVCTSRTDEEHWSDRCAMTQFGDFEAEDTRRDRKACICDAPGFG